VIVRVKKQHIERKFFRVFPGSVSDDSELLECDAVSLGEWFPVFHKNNAVSHTKHKCPWKIWLFMLHHSQSIFQTQHCDKYF